MKAQLCNSRLNDSWRSKPGIKDRIPLAIIGEVLGVWLGSVAKYGFYNSLIGTGRQGGAGKDSDLLAACGGLHGNCPANKRGASENKDSHLKNLRGVEKDVQASPILGTQFEFQILPKSVSVPSQQEAFSGIFFQVNRGANPDPPAYLP